MKLFCTLIRSSEGEIVRKSLYTLSTVCHFGYHSATNGRGPLEEYLCEII